MDQIIDDLIGVMMPLVKIRRIRMMNAFLRVFTKLRIMHRSSMPLKEAKRYIDRLDGPEV